MLSDKRVLVVDDEASIAKLVALVIAELGVQTDTATNGADALLKIEQNKPDLVILDLIMPVMTGEDLIQELQGNPDTQDIPIVLLTTRQGAAGYKKGAFPLIPKPFEPAKVKELVNSILGE
jgi:two-component system, chemotaxis family, chemotaxis protein CheY